METSRCVRFSIDRGERGPFLRSSTPFDPNRWWPVASAEETNALYHMLRNDPNPHTQDLASLAHSVRNWAPAPQNTTPGDLLSLVVVGATATPTFEFSKPSGVLIAEGHEPEIIESGGAIGARYPFSLADGHVETNGAIRMSEIGAMEATLYVDHPEGTCPNCDRYLPTFLDNGSRLSVVPFPDAIPRGPVG